MKQAGLKLQENVRWCLRTTSLSNLVFSLLFALSSLPHIFKKSFVDAVGSSAVHFDFCFLFLFLFFWFAGVKNFLLTRKKIKEDFPNVLEICKLDIGNIEKRMII